MSTVQFLVIIIIGMAAGLPVGNLLERLAETLGYQPRRTTR